MTEETLSAPAATPPQAAPEIPPQAIAAETQAARPAQRSAQQVLERLFELHPKMFGARFLPLKLGTFQDIVALHPGEFQKDELKAALGFHTRSTRYLESVAQGNPRSDLDGQPVEEVAPEHVHHAIMEVFRRRSARGKDAQAWLRQRLVAAIDASRLSREDYEARVQVRDDAAMAALDGAFGEVREKTARREALQRAFAASGKSLEAFADMYGMKLGEVRQILGTPAAPVPADPVPAPAEPAA